MSDKLVIDIDSTSLGSSSCLRNFYYTVVGSIEDGKIVGGYKSLTSAAAIYGVAIHKFIDVMYKTNGYGHAANKEMLATFALPKSPPPEKKQWLIDEKHLQTTAWNLWNDRISVDSNFEVLSLPTVCYWCGGNKETNGVICERCDGTGIRNAPATELTFRIPFYEDNYCIINLCGTVDRVGKFVNGCFAIRDWKSTSAFNSNDYLTGYELNRQLRVYTLACKLMAKLEPESTLGRIGATRMGACIDAIFLKPKANDNEYGTSDVFQYSSDDMLAFELSLQDFCHKLSIHMQTDLMPKEGILNGTCEQKFSRCRFWNVCKSNDTVASVLLKRDFTRKVYDPLNFNEVE